MTPHHVAVAVLLIGAAMSLAHVAWGFWTLWRIHRRPRVLIMDIESRGGHGPEVIYRLR